jgi:hypothetical protein
MEHHFTSQDLKREEPIMSKVLEITCTLALAVFLFAGNVYAIGLGGYIEFGSGSGEAEYDIEDSEEFDIDTGIFGFGFQLETSPLTANKLFSYRLQVGYESRDIETEMDYTFELDGLVINNTFAFGGTVAKQVRLWGGPQIMIGFYSGETDEEFLGETISFAGAGFGVGAAVGANFGLGGDKVILTTTLGLTSFGFAGNTELNDEDETLSGNATEFIFSLGIMF